MEPKYGTKHVMKQEVQSNLYLVPKGKNGFFYEPEIKEVVEKYATLGADLSRGEVVEALVKDIGAAIREIPLETVAIDDPPMRRIKKLGRDPIVFLDGSTLSTMHDPKDASSQ